MGEDSQGVSTCCITTCAETKLGIFKIIISRRLHSLYRCCWHRISQVPIHLHKKGLQDALCRPVVWFVAFLAASGDCVSALTKRHRAQKGSAFITQRLDFKTGN